MQIKNILTLLTVSFCFFSFTCKKKDAEILNSKWNVESIKETDQGTQTTNETYILEFPSKDIYRLKLDINSCSGEYKIPQSGKTSFKLPGCTEACCDSKFAQDLTRLLSKMTAYEVNGDILTLSGNGEIKLKKY